MKKYNPTIKTLVIYGINACIALNKCFRNKNNINNFNNINNLEKYINNFIIILKKLNFDIEIDVHNAIKNKNSTFFEELEQTLIYFYEDEINFDDNILKKCMDFNDLSLLKIEHEFNNQDV